MAFAAFLLALFAVSFIGGSISAVIRIRHRRGQ